MSDRKRINVSVDPETYDRLQKLTKAYKFKNACELLVSFAHILLDRLEDGTNRKYDLPEDDGAYIDSMFGDLGHITRTPDGTVPVRHNSKKQR